MTERTTLSQVNQGLMDALGLGDLAHKCRSVQVSLHATSWPTARLDLVINRTAGETARRYVRLVPMDIEKVQPVKGFDIDAACDQARAVVAEAIEAKAAQAKFEVKCTFATVKFPRFDTHQPLFTSETGICFEVGNAEAWMAFRDFRRAMRELSDVEAPRFFGVDLGDPQGDSTVFSAYTMGQSSGVNWKEVVKGFVTPGAGVNK